MPVPIRASLSPRRLPIALAVTALVLVACHVAMWTVFYKTSLLSGFVGQWALRFDLDTEASFGTWFSSAVLALAGIVTLSHWHARKDAGDRWDRWWWVLGIVLLFLSLDEVAGVHEGLNSDPAFTAYVGHWTLAGLAVSAVFGAAMLPFLFRLPNRTLVSFVVAGILFVGGGVGVEFATLSYERSGTMDTLAYNLWNALEEGLEMAGAILYLHAMLSYMEDGERSEPGPGGAAARAGQ